MASQGPLFPGTVTSVTSGEANEVTWTNPGNVSADDGTEAQITAATFDSPDPTFYLYARNFGFTIPTGATINGFVVEIDRRSIIANSGIDRKVFLSNELGVEEGNNKADLATVWPTTLTIKSYGGAADMWGTGLTEPDVNDADFGVYFQAQANIANADIAVDFIRVTVHYTEAALPSGPILKQKPAHRFLTLR